MTVRWAFAGLALLLPPEEVQAELARRRVASGACASTGRTTARSTCSSAPYLLCGPQLLVSSPRWALGPQLAAHFYHCGASSRWLPFVLLYLLALWWAPRVRDLRSIYLWSAYLGAALANLAKGPAGLALPRAQHGLYLVLSGARRGARAAPASGPGGGALLRGACASSPTTTAASSSCAGA